MRDLGSRNGTRLDGERLGSEHILPLKAGSKLVFGRHPLVWELESAAGPLPSAIQLDGQELTLEAGLLVLPTPEDPQVLVYSDGHRGWLCEQGAEIRQVQDLDLLLIDGVTWRLHLPEPIQRTVSEHTQPPTLQGLRLHFTVSADEEHVSLVAMDDLRKLDLGSRAHHYALLTLARARLEDARDPDLDESSHGWIYKEELAEMLRVDRNKLNLLMFRARRQLAELGVQDAQGLIEHRPDSRQCRLGVAGLDVTTA